VPTLERHTELVQLTQMQLFGAIEQVLPNVEVVRYRLIEQGRANTNYIVETASNTYVLRIYVRAPEACAKERALHEWVGSRIPVPKIWGSGNAEQGLGYPFSVLDFVPGLTLEDFAASADDAALLNAARALGRVLAELTTFRFEQFGDLQASSSGVLAVVPWSFTDFFRSCLFESPAAARLGSLRDRVWALVEREQGRFSDALPIHLTHGDFSPNNLLLREDGRVRSVLDWEFSHAGKLWQDLGNLFRDRPEFPIPRGFDTALAEGFAEGGTPLPSDWRAHAEFDDLSSALDFLSSAADRPETHARALRQINRLLERFAG
jgi:aminoglycoside phosphotransferase (APT) family kinase protein